MCSGFEIVNLCSPLELDLIAVQSGGSADVTHFQFQRGGGNFAGGENVSYPGAIQAEFLVQHAEEVLDGEFAGGFHGYGGNGQAVAWRVRDR